MVTVLVTLDKLERINVISISPKSRGSIYQKILIPSVLENQFLIYKKLQKKDCW